MSEQPTPGKRDFTDLYTAPDPRPYFRYFADLEYRIIGSGAELSRRVVAELGTGGGPLADVCCSYGQDAALLSCDLTVAELFTHWAADGLESLDRDALLERDRVFFAARRRPDAVPVLGVDASAPAVAYGVESGLLAGGRAADTEGDADVDLSLLAGAGGVVVTGGIGYVGPRTFDRVLDAAGGRPWVAGMVLRWVDLGPLADALRGRGYTVQVAEDQPVVQRAVVDDGERTAVLAGLAALGREPGPLEQAGFHAALPFLATPSGTTPPPLADLAAGLDES